jgi:putative hydrolase of HD superfamily
VSRDAGDRLERQLAFVVELDELKRVLRRSYIRRGERLENSAEHSWHVALMAIVLAEHADRPLDLARLVAMLLVHDVVEIDAGDVFVYDGPGRAGKLEAERRAADRLFGLLPADQAREIRALWEEFEAQETAEARFARALDRLMPLIHNYRAEGRTWRENGVAAAQVFAVNEPQISQGSATLWQRARRLIEDAIAKGWLPA